MSYLPCFSSNMWRFLQDLSLVASVFCTEVTLLIHLSHWAVWHHLDLRNKEEINTQNTCRNGWKMTDSLWCTFYWRITKTQRIFRFYARISGKTSRRKQCRLSGAAKTRCICSKDGVRFKTSVHLFTLSSRVIIIHLSSPLAPGKQHDIKGAGGFICWNSPRK